MGNRKCDIENEARARIGKGETINIIKTDKLSRLLQALSFQIGSHVSMNELADTVGLDHKTVNKYIALLEHAFIIFRPIDLRPDHGALFENYIISELKKQHPDENIYFWRTVDQQEIDFLLEKRWGDFCHRSKIQRKKNGKFPATFINGYSPKSAELINRDNYLDILLKK